MPTWLLIVLGTVYFAFALFKANAAIGRSIGSNAPGHTKILLILVAIIACIVPFLWGEADRLVADHLKKKGWA